MKLTKEFKVVKTKGTRDCHECTFKLECIYPCDLSKGYHIEKC